MKKNFFITMLAIIAFAACSKTSGVATKQPDNNLNQISNTNKKTNFDYLLAHTWRYSKYYLNYVDPTHPGDLVYDRSAGIHLANIGSDTVKFFANGKVIDYHKQKITKGEWSFTDSTQSVVKIIKKNIAYFYDLQLLDRSHLNWTANLTGTGTVYAEMIPKP